MAEKGDIIKVSILRHIDLSPDHYGIYDGDGWVYTFVGKTFASAVIQYIHLSEFESGGTAYICPVNEQKFSPDEIIERARSKLFTDFGGYDLLKNNCEHFVYWCVTGVRKSIQTNHVNPADDNRDIVVKFIENLFNPILNIAGFLDKVFGFETPVDKDD